MKRYILFSVCAVLFFSQSCLAGWEGLISNHYLILKMESNSLASDEAALLKQFTEISKIESHHFKGYSFCVLAPSVSSGEVPALVHSIQRNPKVAYATYYLEDQKGNLAGLTDELLVKVKSKDDFYRLQAWADLHKMKGMVQNEYMPLVFKLRLDKNSSGREVELIEELSKESFVIYAAPNYILHPKVCAVNDPLFNRQWALKNDGTPIQGNGTPGADLHMMNAWDISTGRSTIKVAIIDSGVDTLHPDLQANLLPGKDALGDSTGGYPTPNYDMDGHGTACSGIIAAIGDNTEGIAGAAYGCKIIPVRAFYYMPFGTNVIPYSTAEAFSNAYNWAAIVAKADIMSSSWGLDETFRPLLPGGTPMVTDAINNVHSTGRDGKGIALFFSSGNDNISPVLWPSDQASTISVAATSMCDERKNPSDCSGESWGCNYGAKLSFGAPGVKITTTDMIGSNGFSSGSYTTSFNGTSAACPFAAAVAALVLSVNPDMTAAEVQFLMESTCDTVGGYDYIPIHSHSLWSRELGYGRLNAYRALRAAQIFSGIPETLDGSSVSIYPQPFHDVLHIEGMNEGQNEIRVTDISGRLLLEKTIEGKELNIGGLPTGGYFFYLKKSDGWLCRKLIKQ